MKKERKKTFQHCKYTKCTHLSINIHWTVQTERSFIEEFIVSSWSNWKIVVNIYLIITHSKKSNNSWIELLFFSPRALDTLYQTKQEKYLGSVGFCYLAWLLSQQLTGMLPTPLSGVHISNSTKRTESEFFLQKWNFEFFCCSFRRHVSKNLTGLSHQKI